ncbi:MAG: AAA family ATPase [Acidobacteria bacterium]|nr:AAA family ATPase [Acidobacteriota bacterium]
MDRLASRLKSAFGLQRIPFTPEIHGDFFLHPAFEEGLRKLRYVADRRGMAVLVAGAGVGKSTLLRAFIESLGRTSFLVAYVPEATCGILDLYRAIARAFGIDPAFRKSDLLRRIQERLPAVAGRKICPVLICDEAHLLNRTFFDELRILADFGADAPDEMMLLLSGQPQLETSLRLGINEALAQRIVLRVRLAPLDRGQVEQYLAHRLQLAGRTAPLFTPDGIEGLVRASHGVPRLIDRVGEVSLLIALEGKKKEIDAEIVAQAAQEVES